MKIRDSSNPETYFHTRAVDNDEISLNFECANDEAGCCFSTEVVVWTELEPHAINVAYGFGFKPKFSLAQINHSPILLHAGTTPDGRLQLCITLHVCCCVVSADLSGTPEQYNLPS